MLDYFRNLFTKSGSDEPITFKFEGSIKFTLKITDLEIGYLKIEDGLWKFNYSDAFKNQNKYARIAGFSDLNKTYSSEVLWPFFKIRIPGLKQPMIKEIIERENLDMANEALLLSRFGKRTMSNPYILETA